MANVIYATVSVSSVNCVQENVRPTVIAVDEAGRVAEPKFWLMLVEFQPIACLPRPSLRDTRSTRHRQPNVGHTPTTSPRACTGQCKVAIVLNKPSDPRKETRITPDGPRTPPNTTIMPNWDDTASTGSAVDRAEETTEETKKKTTETKDKKRAPDHRPDEGG
ncbi:hypothetical protein P170DRAFT_472452 [Aspergillus steynii IBT 23096]|uniref:Uncharacterized protein n=1 Tax=Aspergillus steynii IBT 23096 TaxID=1392250 RepID=A0A2I2GI57_9EURO|nr:uncharacterized protein P170DRAFT_472452 [Aspergillus steynii IBT 23096]PLB52565.1 hypothetical protein P170DRAFT_472452 [Aspergillus steynii IBT 23096]